MILTLAANAVDDILAAHESKKRRSKKQGLLDLPAVAIGDLHLRGLNIFASSLAGFSMEEFDQLRDRADKAACPCLVLVDDSPLKFGTKKRTADVIERVSRLSTAANRLGCNSVAICCEADDDDQSFEDVASCVRDAMSAVERLELNLLLMPHEGLTWQPDRMTELIKRIGGFRIGSLPSFGHAAATDDMIDTLRKLAPYAGAMHATVDEFTKAGKHKSYDLSACIDAIRAVGFANTLAIEYVGKGDASKDIEHARNALQAAIDHDDS